MDIFNIQASGLKAVGLLAVVMVGWVVLTGARFTRMCGDLDGISKTITFDITTREMRQLAGETFGKSTAQIEAQFNMVKRTNDLHVFITDLKCADTFVLGIVCRATYHLGTGDNAGPNRVDYFRMRRSGKSESWLDYLGPRKALFNHSPRQCTKEW